MTETIINERADGYSDKFPYSAHFLLNDTCNAKCVFCGGDYFRSRSGKSITLEKFKVMARNIHLERFRSACLAGAGDPLLNRDLLPIMRYINETYPQCAITITTNGIALSRQLSETMIGQCNVQSVNISINAATRATYERLMQVDAFDRVVENVKACSALKDLYQSPIHIQFSIALSTHNINELPALVRLAHSLKVPLINVFYCRFYPERIRALNIESAPYRLEDSASLFFHQQFSDEKMLEAKALGEQLGVFLVHEPLFSQPGAPRPCLWTEDEIMIGFDGEIYPCGGGELHFKEKVASGAYDFGNALTQQIEEFWNNETYRALRVSSKHCGAGPIPECGECANRMIHTDIRSHLMQWQGFEESPAPLVSVIVPTFNRPDMLAIALKSILAQTFQDFEILVVNDAGEDVRAVVDGFASPKIRYLCHEANKGLAASRNTGIRAARGKYIAYLDDDDSFYPDHLETLVTALEGKNLDVAYTDAYKDVQQKQGDRYVTVRRETPYSYEFDYDKILIQNFIPVLCIMHRRACLEKSGLFDETLLRHEDWDLWIRMSRHFTFTHIPKLTCEFTYRCDGSAMTSGSMPLFLATIIRVFEKYESLIPRDSDIARKRGKTLFEAYFRTFHFIADHLTSQSSIESLPYAELKTSGATPEQIRSTYFWQKALQAADRNEAIRLLKMALSEDSQNHPARTDIVARYIEQGMFADAIAELSVLTELNPLEAGFTQTLTDLKAHCGMKAPPPPSSDEPILQASPQLRVAVYSLDDPKSACAQLRLKQPLAAMGAKVELFWGAHNDGVTCTADLGLLEKADLIVLQRFFPRNGTMPFIEQMLASGKPVIYEADDYLLDVPVGHPLKARADETSVLLRQLLPRMSAITVSSELLRERYQQFNPETYLVPNLLDRAMWNVPSSAPTADRVVIGFCGTDTHGSDLSRIEPALRRIAAKYGDKVHFRFMGYAPASAATLPGFSFQPFQYDYLDYARALANSGFDIAIVPLQDTPFNRCKSNIKWLEYSACGIAGVFADLPPYNATVEHGKTGLLVGQDPEKWFRALEFLVDHPDIRTRIARAAKAEVLERFCLAEGSHPALNLYERLLSASRSRNAANKGTHATSGKKFSIIILTWNRAAMLDQCLKALFSSLASPLDCEIIVGNNGSTDETEEVLKRYRVDKYIRKESNIGLELYRELFAQAEGDYIIELDDDVLELPRHFEREFERHFRAFPDYGLLGLDVIQNQYTNGAKPESTHYRLDVRAGLTVEEGPVIGCCLCISRKTFSKIGGFENALLSMAKSEDDILYNRVRQAGFRAGILSGIRCFHASGPHYSKAYGYLQRDQEKYRISGLHDFVERYAEQETDPVYLPENPAIAVSIVIPLYNQATYTRQCLEALARNTGNAVPFELVIVDNGSTDETPELLKSLTGNVTVVSNRANLGFARACNQGAKLANGRYLLFLNNDTVPEKGWLVHLVKSLESVGADIAGGLLLFPDGTVQHAGIAFSEQGCGYHIFSGFAADSPAVTTQRFMQAVTGACMLVKRDLFEKLTGFDEGFMNGFEDIDLCLRAGEHGAKVLYAPSCRLVHFAEVSEGRKDHDAKNIQHFSQRWHGRIRFDDEEYYRDSGYSKVHGADRTFTVTPVKNAHMSNEMPDQSQTAPVKLKQLQLAFTRNPADMAVRAQLISTLESLGCHSEADRLKKL